VTRPAFHSRFRRSRSIAKADSEEGLQREERLRDVACGSRVEADADVIVGEDVVDAVAALGCEKDVGVPDTRGGPRACYHEEKYLERRLQVELRPTHNSLAEVGFDNLVESGATLELVLERLDFRGSVPHHLNLLLRRYPLFLSVKAGADARCCRGVVTANVGRFDIGTATANATGTAEGAAY